jgi:hypothetical protein
MPAGLDSVPPPVFQLNNVIALHRASPRHGEVRRINRRFKPLKKQVLPERDADAPATALFVDMHRIALT